MYDFTTHRRDKQSKLMYGADVIIFEGILAFYNKELCELMDMKVRIIIFEFELSYARLMFLLARINFVDNFFF